MVFKFQVCRFAVYGTQFGNLVTSTLVTDIDYSIVITRPLSSSSITLVMVLIVKKSCIKRIIHHYFPVIEPLPPIFVYPLHLLSLLVDVESRNRNIESDIGSNTRLLYKYSENCEAKPGNTKTFAVLIFDTKM